MRITLDARMMGATHTRGIGRYIEELVRGMIQVAPEHRYILLMRQPEQSPFQGHASVEHVVADVPWYGFSEQLKMPGLLAQTKPDIVHVPHWNVPVLSSLPRVVTIHDLLLLDDPESAKVSTRHPIVASIKRLGYTTALRAALGASRNVLVPTQWVANDIKKRFPGVKTPITVTGEGMPEAMSAMWQDADLIDPYLLYVGSAYPHKNLDSLFDAWKKLVPQHPTVSLVMAGERDVFMQRLEARVEHEQLPRVRFLGRVTDEQLSILYSKALALVYPSKNEGFGLPPLEAFAHGCPVIAARATSLPEVLGEQSATFFEPGASDDILRAIETVLGDPMRARVNARQSVPALQQRHSWMRAAEHTLKAYQQAVQKGG